MLKHAMMKAGSGLALAILIAACQQSEGENVPGNSDDKQPYSGIAEDAVLMVGGTEPFWSARIEGGTLVYSTPDNIDGLEIAVERFAGRGGLSFSGNFEGRPLDLAVTPGDCSDGMSDRTYPYTATMQIGRQQLLGCAYTEGDDLGPPP